MKYIHTLFFILMGLAHLFSQPDSVQFYLSVKDSSKTIFSHDVIRMWQSDFPTADGVTIVPDWDRKGSGIEIKFPHREWTQYDYFIVPYHHIEPFRDGLMIQPLNLMPMFMKDTLLFNDVKNGAKIYLRFRYNLRWKNQNTFSVLYSEVDSLWLPPANQHDVEGLHYIKQHQNEIKISSYNGYITATNDDKLDTLSTLFPLSIIGELAMHEKSKVKIQNFLYEKTITHKEELVMLREEFLRYIQQGRSDIVSENCRRAYEYRN